MAQAGGNAAILARGDATAGAILIVCRERGVMTALLERALGDGGYAWIRVGPPLDTQPGDSFKDSVESRVAEWIAKRRSRDPDLWIVELDIPESERFAAEVTDDG